MQIKAVLIDIDDTLLDFNACARECMQMVFEDWGLTFGEQVFATFKRINDGLWLDYETGKIDRSRIFGLRWNMILDELGLRDNYPRQADDPAESPDFRGYCTQTADEEGRLDGNAFEQCFRHYLFNSAVPVKGADKLLSYLGTKYVIYAVSNGSQVQQENRLNNGGLLKYLDDVMTSERMGYRKPQKEFFDGVFGLIPEKPEECVLIGNSLTADIGGGTEYGLSAIWLNMTGETPPEDMKIDYTVESLEEIHAIL